MRQGSSSSLKKACSTSVDESEAVIPMPADVREEVVALLAKILVLDYELFQGVTGDMVTTPTVSNRKLRLVQPAEKAD